MAKTTEVPSSSTAPAFTPWAGADFGELDAFLADTAGESFAMAEGGQRVHEWYRTDPSHTQDVASAQKSVLSLLVGRAIADGAFALDTTIDDVLGPKWTPTGQSAGITVEHLLTMTSGLDDNLTVVAEPGKSWVYSAAFEQLFEVITSTTGRELNDVADEWLFAPAGAASAEFHERRVARLAGIGLRATARDLVAIGQSVIDRTIPGLGGDWLDASFTPGTMNHAYGYLWWLNGQITYRLPRDEQAEQTGPLIPAAPMDTVAALGKDDQKLYLSDDLGLVVARQGARADNESRAALSGFDNDLWTVLLRLRGHG
ncbi:MAG: serine hydrolase [Aquihabitans sp.]